MKVRLLLQKRIESNVKPQPVNPQHKEVKLGTFVFILIVQQGNEKTDQSPNSGLLSAECLVRQAHKATTL